VTIVEALIDLQEVDGRIRDLELMLKDLPRRRALETARLTEVSANLLAAKECQNQVERRAKSYEEYFMALEEKIQDLKKRQAMSKTNKEYQQYSIQIDLVTHERDAAGNNHDATMDNLPSAKERISEAQSKYDSAKSNVDAYCAEIDERIASVTKELEAEKELRAEKLKQVTDPKFVLYYERLRTKRWPVVVPLTHEGVCDGCHLVQPPSIKQLAEANSKNGEMGKEQSIVACTMCGRILYRP
jgi:predicted  nucleic acid-binding Zn-ribbon protein